MTVLFVGLFFLLIVIGIFGDYFFEFLNATAPNKKAVLFFTNCYNFLKLPLVLFFLYINIKTLYKMLPGKDIPKKSLQYSALFTTIVWIIGTEVYSIYFRFFAKYNLFYGSISNLIMLMVWVYFLACIFGGMLTGIGIALAFKAEASTRAEQIC